MMLGSTADDAARVAALVAKGKAPGPWRPLEITLPAVPTKELSQNHRASRGQRIVRNRDGGRYSEDHAKAIAIWRQTACIAAQNAANQADLTRFLPARRLDWRVRFELPDFSLFVRDQANAIEVCKPMLDGLVDAGLVPNDTWDCVAIRLAPMRLRAPEPRTILNLWLYW